MGARSALNRRRQRLGDARWVRLSVWLAGLVVVTAVPACGDDGPEPSAERFCGEVEANKAAIVDPALATVADVDATLELYRDIGDTAPLAIEREWDALVLNLETASTVVPTDPASVQRAYTQAYATEQSALRVRQWLLTNCNVDIGPVATVAPTG